MNTARRNTSGLRLDARLRCVLALLILGGAAAGQDDRAVFYTTDPQQTLDVGGHTPPLPEPPPAWTAMPSIESVPHETPPKFHLRGRIDTDFIATEQSEKNLATFGDLGDTIGFRRARIGAQGNFSEDSRYVAEIDLATGYIIVRDAYVAFGKVQETGEYKFGHMREPFSLEGGTSANSFAFMERSPINTLDPARNWGVGFTRADPEERRTLSSGVFAGGTDANDIEFGPGSTAAFTLRMTGLAWYEDHGQDLMHFAFAVSERVPLEGVIAINEQPQSPLLDFGDSSSSPFIPKLLIPASFQQLFNVQWAYVRGSFWAQSEWYGSYIAQNNGGPVFLHGSYIDVGYFLTGEHRNYLTNAGVFGAVSVKRPIMRRYSSKSHEEELGYGAWEATARFSYLDFIDSDTPLGADGQLLGVKLPAGTLGMNWYLTDRLRIMFNYTYAVPDEANTGASSVSTFSMRVGSFW